MKNNINYYQHSVESHNHAKFKLLRVQYGWEGEGKFWALNNEIGKAENCVLDISKKYNRASLANDLDFSLEDLDKFIQFLLEDCELLMQPEKGFITTDTIQQNLKKVMEDREQSRQRKNRSSAKKLKSSPEPTPNFTRKESKVKESKVKESKFSEFWKLYGVDEGRAMARNLFMEFDIEKINTIIEKTKIYIPKKDIKHRKEPFWYLKGEHWNDNPRDYSKEDEKCMSC